MLFTVEATYLVVRKFRLQEGGKWMQLERDISLKESDKKLRSLSEVENYCKDNQIVSILGQVYKANPSGPIQLGDRGVVFLSPRLFRFERPSLPNKEDLVEKIKDADQNRLYSPVINLNGKVDLVDWREKNPVKNYSIAVRAESISNDYLGSGAARDEGFISSVYNCLLDGWLMHLKTGELNIYMDFGSGKSEENLLNAILVETNKLPDTFH